MRHLRLFTGILALISICVSTQAETGDSFTIDNLTYTVLTEDSVNASGTVSVKAKSTSISGEVVIPETVTYDDCSYTVTQLASSAFNKCKSITSVTVPATVTAIPTYCFSNCSKLTSVDIPSSVTSLGTFSFNYCVKLAAIDIPNTATSIPEGCFMYCSSLQSVDFPSTLTSIGNNAFYGCSSLVTANNLGTTKIKKIGNWAFYNTALETVELPKTLTTIGDWAFAKCAITSIVGMNETKLSKIGVDAFADCVNLTTVLSFPKTLKATGQGAFHGCTGLTGIDLSGSITTVNLASFCGCSSLKDLVIPSNVKTIGGAAFYNCTSLESINIPSTLTRCGTHYWVQEFPSGAATEAVGNLAASHGAFEGCTNIKSVTIEEGVTSLGARCFSGTSIEEIHIPKSMTHLGYLMSDSMVNATMKSNVEDGLAPSSARYQGGAMAHSFDFGLFENCKSLKKVTFTEDTQLSAIGPWCFLGCTSLDTLDIPSTVRYIGASAFSGTTFEYIKLPDNLEMIGDAAFSGCDNLRLIKIPNSVKYMKTPVTYSLNGTHKDSVYTDKGEVKSLYGTNYVNGSPTGAVFADNDAQTHVTLPSWLLTSGQVIRGCGNISEITIPAYVKRGGDLIMNTVTPLKSVFFMGDSIPKGFERAGG